MVKKYILAGDIGATKTRLGVFGIKGYSFYPISERDFFSRDYKGLEDVLKEFLKGDYGIDAACFGIAAPITGDTIMLTNLPWRVDTKKLKRDFSIKKLEVINDLVANAYGISVMRKDDFKILNAGKIRHGNAALLSAGTGLGEAILFWDGKRYWPSPSEGGHAEFAPRNQLELRLLEYLIKRFRHVSYERVLSGKGLLHIYQFLREERRFGSEPIWLSKMMSQKDPAAVISDMAKKRRSRLCMKTLEIFCTIYGAAAGNVALHAMALGGIYIGGGIAPKIYWKLEDGTFMKAFKDKGRYSNLLAQIPVKVIMNERTTLLGAAFRARELINRISP